MEDKVIILGLDPDKGWALVSDKKIECAGTVRDITELKKEIKLIMTGLDLNEIPRSKWVVRIERPTNLKTFPRPGLSYAAMMKISQNCGQNYRKATELGEYCESLGIQYEFVGPARKKWGKMPWKEFNKLTGYTGRSSEHARDAIGIAMRK